MICLSLGSPAKTVSVAYPSGLEEKITNSIFTSLYKKDIDAVRKDINYQIEYIDQKYHLYRNSRKTHQNINSHKIIYALEWQIVNDFLNAYRSKIKLHAAALSFNNQGSLFVGESGTGKTSISILLMRYNWNLLSDEFGILDYEKSELYPFPRNFIIKPHHPISENQKNQFVNTIYRTDTKRLEIYYVPPGEFGQTLSTPVKLNRIYYLRNTTSPDFSIRQLKAYEALPIFYIHLSNPNLIRRIFLNFSESIFNGIQHYEIQLPNPLTLDKQKQIRLIDQLTPEES